LLFLPQILVIIMKATFKTSMLFGKRPLATFVVFILLMGAPALLLQSCGTTHKYPSYSGTQQIKPKKSPRYGKPSEGRIRIKDNYVIRK